MATIPNPLLTLDDAAVVAQQGDELLRGAELRRRVVAVGAFCRQHGLGRGDRVALDLPASLDFIALFFGCLEQQLLVVPLNQRLPAAERRAQAAQLNCAHYFDGFDWSEESDGELSAVWDLDADATAIFTSGSTGAPKAALHSLGNHYYSALGSAENIPLAAGDRWLLSLPLHHVGGLATLFRCLFAGATMVIAAGSEAAEGITHYSFVPTQLDDFLKSDPASPPKAVLVGGAAIAPALVERARQCGVPLYRSYGSTEMSSQICTTRADDEELRSVGHLLPYRELRLAEDGEIMVGGKTLFRGYLGEEERDADWFATGDRGYLDDQGRLVVIGRKDSLIISGGENIQPEEIEELLLACCGLTAVVVAVPDERFGQRPVAFVGGKWSEAELRPILAARLPAYKVPDHFYALPDCGGLKPDRAQLSLLAVSKRSSTET